MPLSRAGGSMSLETLKDEREKIVRVQKEILANPRLSAEHDPGLLNKLEIRREVLNMVIMIAEENEARTLEAVEFWLSAKLKEKNFIREEIEVNKCNGTIPAIIIRGERFQKLEFEIKWLEELLRIEARG
jgi:hypothetical protein